MIKRNEYRKRLKNAQKSLETDAFLVTKQSNVKYLTGADSGKLLLTKDDAKFWLKQVYFGMAKESPVKPIEPEEGAVSGAMKAYKKTAVDDMSLSAFESVCKKLPRKPVLSDTVEKQRAVKSEEELKLLIKSANMGKKAIAYAEEVIKPGVSEFEATAKIEGFIREQGSEYPPFGSGLLCLGGPNAGYPHKPPSSRKFRESDLVVVDLGAVHEGYYSDMTRTFRLGKVPEKHLKIADFIDGLEKECISMIKPGVEIKSVFDYANEAIKAKGYKFAHLLGHGVGLDIHEKPSLGPKDEDVFEKNMVVTAEPGIYAKGFGCRSEDTIIVGKKNRVIT